jgi:magnesium transporter
MPENLHWKELAKRLKTLPEKTDIPDDDPIVASLADETAADIALALEELSEDQAAKIFLALEQAKAAEVLSDLEPVVSKKILAKLPADKLSAVVNSLPPRDAATLVIEAPRKQINKFIKDDQSAAAVVHDVEHRLKYPKASAGRLMTTQFLRLYTGITVADAIAEIRKTDPDVDLPADVYMVKKEKGNSSHSRLQGVISIRDLIMADPKDKVDRIMARETVSIVATAREVDAAALMSKHKFMTLPVTDKSGFLVGIIPADDLMQVIVDRMRSQYSKAVGTDAEAMEHLTPFQAAKKRVPWLLTTMAIELLAGMVISHFDGVLKKVILLASFMPVISAISGNVGLQAAAITVRAVDSGVAKSKSLFKPIRKETATTLLMALVCGLTLGVIGIIWSKKVPFGMVIGGAMTCSMVTAGLMGTIIPVISKRLGFDPATTAGPFETAFQDVVGFGVFLWLATLFQQWIS